ncbi:MAG: flagellar filament capping protein FliD [Solirubrobacteraceae bacterium]
MTVVSSSTSGAPISFSGLSSGLNTSEIISALLGVERAPITHLTDEQITLEGQRTQLQSIQSNLTKLTFDAQELGSPTLFNTSQAVTSSEPTRVAAATTAGAAVGGYEVEVTQLANSGQRTFTFKSPAAAETLTIDGKEIEVAAGATIEDLVKAINSDSTATVYAAAVGKEAVVLSTRETGAKAAYIEVADPGGTLVEQAGLAKEGVNAQYTIDGVAGTSASNKLTSAIPGVTLELKALTTTTGPVTVDVQPPGPSVSSIVTQVQAFVTLYNSTIGAINSQLTTKPITGGQSAAELQTGTLFGDFELGSLLNAMRQSIYEPGKELPAEMSSLADIGISTGAPTGNVAPSQGTLEGQLTVNTAQLESAIEANPAGVEKMLQSFSKGFEGLVNVNAGPGGSLEARLTGDTTQTTELSARITNMNEMLAIRQKTLESEFAAMEKVMAQSQSQSAWLNAQLTSMLGSDSSSSSSSKSSSSGG